MNPGMHVKLDYKGWFSLGSFSENRQVYRTHQPREIQFGLVKGFQR